MMRPESLSDKIQEVCCEIDNKKFVPLDSLESVVTLSNVATELSITETARSDLPRRVVEQANKVFGALILMDRTDYIKGLLNEKLENKHLPLSFDPDSEALRSHDGTMLFPFERWSKPMVRDFESRKQWLFLAPVLNTSGQLLKLEPNCPLPFTDSSFKGSGATSFVHYARVHTAHQQGFDTETVNLQVAVKQFFDKGDFDKEHAILEKINLLHHSHIIRHLASIDKDDKGYTIFPWAERGNLHEFWETKCDQVKSTAHTLWALRQMQGLAAALHLLHQEFNCRHGDVKPANILCFTEGSGGSGDSSDSGDLAVVLKIADFGISRIHSALTKARKLATTTLFLTTAYQGPEVEFETMDDENPQPRSRKYDIWSLGCVYLEFLIWLLYGPKAVSGFDNARGTTGPPGNHSTSSPWYEVTNKAAKAAKVHQLVAWTFDHLQNDPRCAGETLLAVLIGIIKDQMLQPDVDERPSAEDVSQQLQNLVQEGEKRPASLIHACGELQDRSLDFSQFQFRPLPDQEAKS